MRPLRLFEKSLISDISARSLSLLSERSKGAGGDGEEASCDAQPIKKFFFEKKYRDALKPRNLNLEVVRERCISVGDRSYFLDRSHTKPAPKIQ